MVNPNEVKECVVCSNAYAPVLRRDPSGHYICGPCESRSLMHRQPPRNQKPKPNAVRNQPIKKFNRNQFTKNKILFFFRQLVLEELVSSVQIVKLQVPHFGDEIIKVSQCVMLVDFIINFIM